MHVPAVLADLAAVIDELRPGRRVLVGVDGPDAAGKTAAGVMTAGRRPPDLRLRRARPGQGRRRARLHLMTEAQILTSVTAHVPADREDDLLAGYRDLIAGSTPDGLLRSELLRAPDGSWQIQTLWRDKAAILASRVPGQKPPALRLIESLGAEHSHQVLTVELSSP